MLKNYVLADPQLSWLPPHPTIISTAPTTATATATTSASLNQQTRPGKS